MIWCYIISSLVCSIVSVTNISLTTGNSLEVTFFTIEGKGQRNVYLNFLTNTEMWASSLHCATAASARCLLCPVAGASAKSFIHTSWPSAGTQSPHESNKVFSG